MRTIEIKDPFSTPVGTIGLCNGKTANLLGLTVADMDIRMIAHSLSLQNRFNGHTKYPFSVAAHSLNCLCIYERLYGPNDPVNSLAILLHDAEEAFWGDVIAPVKQILFNIDPDMKAVFDRTSEIVFEAFGVQHCNRALIKEIDILSLQEEWDYFFGRSRQCDRQDYIDKWNMSVLPEQTEELFLRNFHTLYYKIQR